MLGEVFVCMRKTLLTIWSALSNLSLNKLGTLFITVIGSPFLSLFTLYATYKCLKIIRKKYPKTHHESGVGNAYRHALWSSLILMYCCKITSSKKALAWCIKITDLHEELFPNPPLERKMDEHNNQVGIDIFMNMLKGVHRQFFETSFITEKLDAKVKSAKLITSLEDEFPIEFVYLDS